MPLIFFNLTNYTLISHFKINNINSHLLWHNCWWIILVSIPSYSYFLGFYFYLVRTCNFIYDSFTEVPTFVFDLLLNVLIITSNILQKFPCLSLGWMKLFPLVDYLRRAINMEFPKIFLWPWCLKGHLGYI